MTQYVSEHFTWNEVISSQKAAQLGIDNSQVPPEVRTATLYTASRMEIVKQVLHMVSIYVDSCLSYSGSSVIEFKADAAQAGAWRDKVWVYIYSELSKLESSNAPLPDLYEFISTAPVLGW